MPNEPIGNNPEWGGEFDEILERGRIALLEEARAVENVPPNVMFNEMRWVNNVVAPGAVLRFNGRVPPEAMPAIPADREPNNPDLWNKILKAVNEIYDNEFAIIAGGCVRDFLAGDEAKDIDVFLNLKYSLEPREFLELGEQLGFRDVAIKGNPVGYKRMQHTKMVLGGHVHGWGVDIIVTNAADPDEVMKGFDFHICQHYYDGNQIRSTEKAQADIRKKVWTPSLELDAESREHFNRVNRRVGGKYKLFEPFAAKDKTWYHKQANMMATNTAAGVKFFP